ncbi:DUF1367 family protein [Vibrio parahaemolyticus]|nr:DUF1367 family protein [Vibrio parahaemolyticus]
MMQTVRAKKEKHEILGIIGSGGYLEYASSDIRELASDMKGCLVSVKRVKSKKSEAQRILGHHRKFFVLMDLGFQHWVPDEKLTSEPEEWIAHETAKQFCKLAGREDMYETHGMDIAELALSKMRKQRSNYYDPDTYKSKDRFRYKVMVDSGFFDLEILPNGGVIKHPWSISFINMDQEQFNKIYRGCFNTIWKIALFRKFANEEEANRVMNQMLGFEGYKQ